MAKTSYQRKAQKKKTITLAIAFVAVCILAAILYVSKANVPFIPNAAPDTTADISVHFIDVGQGDCILIQDYEKTALIDAGENEKGTEVVQYLKRQGVEKIDLMIGTHPHSDHIGGLDVVMQHIPTKTLLIPNVPDDLIPTTKTYTDLLGTAEDTGAVVQFAVPGQSFALSAGQLDILGPVGDYDNLNSYSVVAKFTHGKSSFLLTGDAESDAEKDLAMSGQNLHATVLKAGHHGSSTSSSKDFLNKVGAQGYVICVGADNSYGHPSKQTIDRLDDKPIYRTDVNGSIIFESDGEQLQVVKEKG